MDLKDTKLPDFPAVREAFNKVAFVEAMRNSFHGSEPDLGTSIDSPKLMIRSGEILSETVPNAGPLEIAAAVLFPSAGFQEPVLARRGFDQAMMSQIGDWAQEWRYVQIGEKFLEDASLEIRQIVVASNTALLEGLKDNVQGLDRYEALQQLQALNHMVRDAGDIQAPALSARYQKISGELKQLLTPSAPKKAPSP